MAKHGKKGDWLMPTVLILFLLAVILIPFAAERTYAGRSDAPHHILTYTPGSLLWDNATNVNTQTGAAELSLFSSSHQNVVSQNGEKIVAPGTEGTTIIRLKNDAANAIDYIAILYCIKEAEALPVAPSLTDNEAFSPAATYPLPEGVSEDQVVSAVTGSVEANELQDFDITWLWNYYENDARDQTDTALGNKAAWDTPDEVQAGVYIVVEEEADSGIAHTSGPEPSDPAPPDTSDPEQPGTSDPDKPGAFTPAQTDGDYLSPKVPPQTGDTSKMTLYLVLMTVSGVLLLLLIWDRRKE